MVVEGWRVFLLEGKMAKIMLEQQLPAVAVVGGKSFHLIRTGKGAVEAEEAILLVVGHRLQGSLAVVSLGIGKLVWVGLTTQALVLGVASLMAQQEWLI